MTGIHDKINIFKFERDTLDRAGVQVGGNKCQRQRRRRDACGSLGTLLCWRMRIGFESPVPHDAPRAFNDRQPL
jgi:hypothetical protein